ncbi:TlpA family protein disulfide reductase [Jeotgalibacillus salarius]|uniref:TlpA family protein disulfide reductase n=1 Tax=Jeotgalibacillus salarius TaxID=546023 RepID=A0A4Y8LLH2_9BACL|nr:TlpA disulfide reductase family protein [Jeotgalibacillus salarius]TFE03898.1 TlpA family protein disulfide reductase [Jeotgalibacillus salarius]
MMVQRVRMAGWVFAVMCCAGVFFLISAEPGPEYEPVMQTLELNEAPDFILAMQDGTELTKQDFSGKPLILNFWTSWCPPCIEEMPELKKFTRDHPDINLIGVNLTKEEFKKESAFNFIDDHQINFPIALDEDGDLQKVFRIFTIPITVVITPDGRIYETFFGPVTAQQLEKKVNALLSENTAS